MQGIMFQDRQICAQFSL